MAEQEKKGEEESVPRTEVWHPDTGVTVMSTPRPGKGFMDDHTICGKIGGGGMGVVFLARDLHLDRYVAVKRLTEAAQKDPVLRKRFLQEARAVAMLNHANIVHINSFGEDALGPYIEMEYVAGPTPPGEMPPKRGDPPSKSLTLEQYINIHGERTAEEAVEMVLKIANAMVYSHSMGVIHRDLKPSNILLDPSMEPKVVDFGVAHMGVQRDNPSTETLTMPGEQMVSFGYSAPELQVDASISDGRADVYSLGAILFFLITKTPPQFFHGKDQAVPAFLHGVLERSLERVREQRYSSVQAFVDALKKALKREPDEELVVKKTWRCKWCDTVISTADKCCPDCGWSGTEPCLECGAETFVGQTRCTECGADRRSYEQAFATYRLIEQAWEGRQYESIRELVTNRLLGVFRPSGRLERGRKLLADAQQKLKDAEQAIARRTRLMELIPAEIKAENYERAQKFIEELRQLHQNPLVYESELKQIPGKILNRDLVRLRQSIRAGDWESAQQLVLQMTPKYGNVPEFLDVKNLLIQRKRARKRWVWASVLCVTAVAYLLIVPWMATLLGGTLTAPLAKAVFTPACALAKVPGLGAALDRYVALCDGGKRMEDYFRTATESTPEADEDAFVALLPKEMRDHRQVVMDRLAEIETMRRTNAANVLMQYSDQLLELRTRAQEAGNFNVWKTADEALADYRKTTALGVVREGDPSSLVTLKRRMAQLSDEHEALAAGKLLSAVRSYSVYLEDALRKYTQQNNMEVAMAINQELARIRTMPEVERAEAMQSTVGSILIGKGYGANDTEEDLDAMLTFRRDTLAKLAKIDEDIEQKLGDWPLEYTQSLQALMKQFQESGEFNAWEATSQELERFKREDSLIQLSTADVLDGAPTALRELQESFHRRVENAATERKKAKEAFFNETVASLETQLVTLTKEGKMKNASRTNNILRNLNELSGVILGTTVPPMNSSTRPRPATQNPPPAQVPVPQPSHAPTSSTESV